MQVAVLPTPGENTPLLMSKEMLKALGAQIDMTSDSMLFTTIGVKVNLRQTSRGHYAIPLFEGTGHELYSSGRNELDGSVEVFSNEHNSK